MAERQITAEVPPLWMDAEMRHNLKQLAKIEGLSMKTTAKLIFRNELERKKAKGEGEGRLMTTEQISIQDALLFLLQKGQIIDTYDPIADVRVYKLTSEADALLREMA